MKTPFFPTPNKNPQPPKSRVRHWSVIHVRQHELNRVAFDETRHLRNGDDADKFNEGNSKNRLARVVEVELPGPANSELRSFVRKAVSLAHSIKHAPNSSRREAGIIADSVIMLVNIFRRMFESV
ncbi:hypothetical protein [Corynebacterium striatum]|uniref:hypothetical protein n=1 Tax=Corynebacterium striatum TaxID=43770 RepID=UPI003B5C253D